MTAPESDSSGEIIIKGGSCEIEFEEGHFNKDTRNPRKPKHKHKRDDVLIRRIMIEGNQAFDSDEIPEGFKGQIRIMYDYKR
jgi:hypothetical protein